MNYLYRLTQHNRLCYNMAGVQFRMLMLRCGVRVAQ